MAQTSINIRMDLNLKRDFEAVCSEIGLSMSAAFTVFAKSVSTRKEFPFALTTRLTDNQKAEWGNISYDNLINVVDAAGVAGKWNNNIDISAIKKSAWAEAAVKKEMQKKGKK